MGRKVLLFYFFLDGRLEGLGLRLGSLEGGAA